MPFLYFLRRCRYAFSIAMFAIIIAVCGCAAGPSVVGKWQAEEGTASVSFGTDGIFHAVDNEGMAVSGNYRLVGADGIQFEVLHGGHESELIDARVAREGDRLMLIFPGENAVDTYLLLP